MFCSFPFLTRIKYFESKLDNIETSDLYISSVRKNHSDSFQHVQYFFLKHVSVRPDPDLQHKRIYGEYCQNIAAGHFCVLAVFVFSGHFFVMSSSEAIAGGVAGFWGCVLGLGSLYIMIVLIRRSLNSVNSSSEDNKEDI